METPWKSCRLEIVAHSAYRRRTFAFSEEQSVKEIIIQDLRYVISLPTRLLSALMNLFSSFFHIHRVGVCVCVLPSSVTKNWHSVRVTRLVSVCAICSVERYTYTGLSLDLTFGRSTVCIYIRCTCIASSDVMHSWLPHPLFDNYSSTMLVE